MVKSGSIKNCLHCGREHYVIPAREKRGAGKFCSRVCKGAASRGVESKKKGNAYPHLKRAKTTICKTCKEPFSAINDHKNRLAKFCSKKCWAERRVLKKCQKCGGDIVSYHGKKYCSRKCSHDAMIGESAPQWKDGKSLERDRARMSIEVKAWRMGVFKRDKYTCQHCGTKKDLQAHHIVEWAKDESRRFDVPNGLTLCIDCHGKVHKMDFRKRHDKKCLDCGTRVKIANTRCRSCTTKKQWERQRSQVIVDRMIKLDPEIEINKNGQPYFVAETVL